MRRKLFIGIALCVFVLLLQSFANKAEQRLRFRKYNWTDIGRSARSQNKMIFVLITGEYCSTSKKLNRVMTDKRVCEFYNKNFISTKFDADNFLQFYRASNWGISKVPAMVFLDKNRNVIHKAEGYLDAQGIIAEGEIALENLKNKK